MYASISLSTIPSNRRPPRLSLFTPTTQPSNLQPIQTSPGCLVDLVYLVCLVYLVDLVHLVDPVSLVQPNTQDKPNKPDEQVQPAEPTAWILEFSDVMAPMPFCKLPLGLIDVVRVVFC